MIPLKSRLVLARRSFFSRLVSAAAVVGATTTIADAQGAPAADGRWQPARHPQDDWLDQIPGKHRLFFDTTTPDELADALQFAGNYFAGNKAGYELEPADLAVVICMRHRSAPFGFNDAMWAKYGATLGARAKFVDPKTQQAPDANLRSTNMANLAKRGVQFALCNLSTRAISGLIAQKSGAKQDDAYTEITANRMSNARLVPAGIVAMSRAQERGYAIA